MAHRLVGDHGSESHQASGEESGDGSGTALLNRRQYMNHTAAAAVVIGSGILGATAASADGSTYTTNFSRGSL